MSTSLLYHAFGIRGYQYVATQYFEREVLFTIRQERHLLRCPVCGSEDVTAHGGETRFFRGLPIGSRCTRVVMHVPRVECYRCGVTRQVSVAFANPRRSYTHA